MEAIAETPTPTHVSAGQLTSLIQQAPAGPWGQEFEARRASRLALEPEALGQTRDRAFAHFSATGFPTLKQEAWRFTNVRPVVEAAFPLAEEVSAGVELVDPHRYSGTSPLVFVDGYFSPQLSMPPALPDGVILAPISSALETHPELVLPHLAQHAATAEAPFAALNTALGGDGLFLYVPKGQVVEPTLHLLYLSVTAQCSTYPRTLIVLEDSAQACVIEHYASSHEDAYFTCPVTEMVLGANATLDHYKVQRESLAAFHVANQASRQGRDSVLRSHSISVGGALVRNDLGAYLGGTGVSSTLNGLYLGEGTQHIDNQMRVDHAEPHGYSHELYKGVLDERSRAVFNGLIHVHPGAQKTDAVQSNQNLLVSHGALANSNPQLEIFADDVRCTHGSTVGQLDPEAIYYLRTRGIGELAARSLLTYAFASDIVSRVRVDSLRNELEEMLFNRLPKGEIVRQAV
ncbi:MAG: Fe-S cluster assembly protein SufD [Acidobacteriota bacterium]